MTGYVLYCTVCKVNYANIRFWNRHLLDLRHQQNARRDLPQWDVEGRKCGIVIYSSFLLVTGNGSAEMVIDYFSKKGRGGGEKVLVTDFVLSWSRPRVAIIQFESRRIVNHILTETDNHSIQIDNQLVQLRGLGEFMELEWEELLSNFESSLETNGNAAEVAGLSVPQLHLPSNSLHTEDEENLKINASIEGSICPQFQSILEEMTIPDEEFNLVLQVAQEIQRVLEETLPPCKVALYRHNYLKLRNNFKSNTYFLFMYISEDDNCRGFRAITKESAVHLLKHLHSQNLRPPLSILNHFSISTLNEKSTGEPAGIVYFTHLRLEHHLQLSTYPPSISELQLSQLVTYYCEFDPRVRPLFSLLFYWAKINRIVVGEDANISGFQTFRLAPDPVALEWLLIFYLCRQEDLLPTPQEILDRPHLRISLRSSGEKNDFGFNFDLEFARSWNKKKEKSSPPEEGSPHFVYSVLELLQKFFHFFGEELSPPCVLRLQDAQTFMDGNTPRGCEFRGNGGEEISKLSIIHPFADQWRLTVNYERWEESVRPKMKITAEKLGVYVKSLKYWIKKRNRSPFLRKLRNVLNAN